MRPIERRGPDEGPDTDTWDNEGGQGAERGLRVVKQLRARRVVMPK